MCTTIMLTFEYFGVLTKIFHFAGHAPIYSLDPHPQTCTQLTSAAMSSCIALSTVIFLVFVPHLTSYGIIHNVIRLCSVLSGSFVIFLANWSCWRHKNVYQRLVQRMHRIEKLIIHTLSLNDSDLIPNFYRTKALIIFILFFVSQTVVFTEVWLVTGNHNLLSSFFNSFLRITHPISVVHFMLYSDTVTICIQKLNEQMKSSPNCLDSTAQVVFLKTVKLMHLDIWKLVRQMNVYFGWNLLFVIIHSFFYVQVQLYWIFLSLQVKFNLFGIIGKSTEKSSLVNSPKCLLENLLFSLQKVRSRFCMALLAYQFS